MPGLRALSYTSDARQPLTLAQIDHLLLRSRQRNEEEGVTGVLLYSNGRFMQYIEGPETGLTKVWAIIQADPLHHHIVELALEPIAIREFDQWSMAFRAGGRHGMTQPMHLDALLSGRMSSYTKSTSHAVKALLSFWNAHRGSDAF